MTERVPVFVTVRVTGTATGLPEAPRAVMVTMSVQLVGVYLVFTTLIVPALATYRHAAGRQLGLGYVVALLSYVIGLGVSVVTDLPSSAVIVWSMAVVAVVVHLTARPGTR